MIYLVILTVLVVLAILDFIHIKEVENLEIENVELEERGRLKKKKQKINPFANRGKVGAIRFSIFIIIILVLIFVVGLRYYTGLDYSSYNDIFFEIIQGQKPPLEQGYIILNKLVYRIIDDPQLVFLIFAIFTIGIKSIVIKKSTNRIFFSLLILYALYFLVGDMGQIRSTFAQSLDLLALYFFIREKRIIALILILCGVIFHVSSIVFLVIFIVGARKYNTKIIIGVIILFAIIGYFLNIKGIGLELRHMYGFLGQKLYDYTNIEAQKIGINFSMLFDMLTLIFLLVVRYVYKLNNRKFNTLLNLYVLAIISMLLFNNYFIIGTRFANYFRLPLIILLPYAISKIQQKRIRFLVLLVFIFVFAMMFIRMLHGNVNLYVPYRMNTDFINQVMNMI